VRAVILATGQPLNGPLLNDRYPVPMLPLVDRPFIQHVIEYLVLQGVGAFDLVLCHLAEQIERFLGSGERWGVTFRYHLARNPFRPYVDLRTLTQEDNAGGRVLLGHADRLPAVRLEEFSRHEETTVVFDWRSRDAIAGHDEWRWSGWALLSPRVWRGLSRRNLDEQGVHEYLLADGEVLRRQEVAPPLRMQCFESILAANLAVLRGEFSGLLINGRVKGGVRLARNVTLHPSAQLVPPVFLGENCEIGAGARVGPNVVVASGCVIDRRSSLSNSLVLGSTYVGEGLELDGAVVCETRVNGAGLSRPQQLEDAYAVGSLAGDCLAPLVARLASMGMGMVLLLLAALPLLVVAFILKIGRRGKVRHLRQVLRLPAGPEEHTWSTFDLWSFCSPEDDAEGRGATPGFGHFFLRLLPALVNVARGDVRLVGLPPRTPGQVKKLSLDWRALYLGGSAGIICVNLLDLEPPTEEEAYAAEGAYVVAGGIGHDLGLLLRYLLAVLGGCKRNAVGARVARPEPRYSQAASPAAGRNVDVPCLAADTQERLSEHPCLKNGIVPGTLLFSTDPYTARAREQGG
jgi:NDP-sugar pyrophosphorylase family protein